MVIMLGKCNYKYIKNIIKYINQISPKLVSILIFTLTFIIKIPFYNDTIYNGDAARYVQNGYSILLGKMPYRDFWDILPPGESYLPAFILKISNLNLNAVQISFVLYGGLISFFSYAILKLLKASNVLAIFITLILFFNATIAPYLVLLLISNYFFIRYLFANENKYLFISGTISGLGLLCRFYESGSLLFAQTIVLYFFIHEKNKSINYFFRKFLILSGGVFIILTPVAILLRNVLNEAFFYVVISSIIHTNGDYVRLPYFTSAISEISNLDIAFDQLTNSFNLRLLISICMACLAFVKALFLYIYPLFSLIIFFYIYKKKILTNIQKMVFVLFLIWGISTFPKVLGRASLGHLYYSTVPLYFLFLYFNKIPNMLIKKTFILFFLFFSLSIPLFLSKNISYSNRAKYTLKTNWGSLNITNKQEYNDIKYVIDYILNKTNKLDYVYIIPGIAPPFYLLTQTQNATYFNTNLDLLTLPTIEKQKSVCQDIINNNVKIIVNYPKNSSEGNDFIKSNPIIYQCINDKYQLVQDLVYYQILIPKT